MNNFQLPYLVRHICVALRNVIVDAICNGQYWGAEIWFSLTVESV